MTEKKRPGSMSDDDRALARLSITPPRGVEVVPLDEQTFEQHEHFTPVMGVIERAVDLTERERRLLQIVWQHTANIEMRSRSRSDSQDSSQLRRDIDALEMAIVDIRGENGQNGKLGALKARVDQAESRRWWAVTALAGLVVTVITASVGFGRWMSSVETDVEWLKQRRRSISQPADAGKDTGQ